MTPRPEDLEADAAGAANAAGTPPKGLPKVKSAATLNIEHAYQESEAVRLLNTPKDEPERRVPLNITAEAAMDAAAIEIKEYIRKEGHITATESAHIIQEKMKVLELVWSHFPGALSSVQVLEGFKQVMEPRGYNDDNVLFAQSICPDEINHEEGDITDLFTKYCGEVFHMGGLAGELQEMDGSRNGAWRYSQGSNENILLLYFFRHSLHWQSRLWSIFSPW